MSEMNLLVPRSGSYPKRFTLILFHLFAANTVFPLFDIPLLGLSVTSVFFALVALELLLGLGYLNPVENTRWLLPVLGIGSGILLSTFANGLSGDLPININHLVALIQAGYWLVVCLVTMALVRNLQQADFRILIYVIGGAIIAVGALRIYEAIAFDRIGSGTSRIFPQNAYGILFSTFTPFGLILLFLARSVSMRFLIAFGIIVLLVGIGINGSRSSWIASAIGLATLSTLFLIARWRKLLSLGGAIAGIALMGVTILSILPSDLLDPISSRFATLQRVEEDKSYATRILMQQKALNLLQENPLFGVGRGQFREAYVQLDFSGTPFSRGDSASFNRLASHNSYAQFIAEQGVIGIVPLAILIALLTIKGFRAAARLGSAGEPWGMAIFASFIAMSVHLWTIDNLQTTSTWFVYGLVAGMIEYERRVNETIILEKV